jgi:hypothetical protein
MSCERPAKLAKKSIKNHLYRDFKQALRRLLQTHAYTTVTFPDNKGQMHHLRIPGTPDSEQQKIYQILNVEWRHLRRSHSIYPATP